MASCSASYLQQRKGEESLRTIKLPEQPLPRSVGLAGLERTIPEKTVQSPPQVKHQLQATAV